MPLFIFSWQVDWYMTEWQKREKQGQGCQWFCSFTWQPTCQNPPKKQRGCLVDHLLLLLQHVVLLQLWTTQNQQTKKSQCPQFLQLSVWSRQMLEKPEKVRKGKAANANLLFSWHVNWYQPINKKSTKKKEARIGVPMVPFLCSATNLPKPKNKEAEKQRSIIFRSSSGMSHCCKCKWHQKNKVMLMPMVQLIVS